MSHSRREVADRFHLLRLPQMFLSAPDFGHVFDRQQDPLLPLEPARVHEQRPPPRGTRIVLHLEIFHHMVRRQNLLEQEPKPGNAPVPAPQLVDEAVLDLGRGYAERPIEGLVGPEYPKVRAENDERGANSVDGGLRKLASAVEFGVADLQLLVDRSQLLIGGLEFLFRAFQLFVEALQFFVRSDNFLAGGFLLANDQLQPRPAGGKLFPEAADPHLEITPVIRSRDIPKFEVRLKL